MAFERPHFKRCGKKTNNGNIFHVFSTIPPEGSQNTSQSVCGRSTTPKNVITHPGALPGLTAFAIFFPPSFSLPSPSHTNDSIFISPQHYWVIREQYKFWKTPWGRINAKKKKVYSRGKLLHRAIVTIKMGDINYSSKLAMLSERQPGCCSQEQVSRAQDFCGSPRR